MSNDVLAVHISLPFLYVLCSKQHQRKLYATKLSYHFSQVLGWSNSWTVFLNPLVLWLVVVWKHLGLSLYCLSNVQWILCLLGGTLCHSLNQWTFCVVGPEGVCLACKLINPDLLYSLPFLDSTVPYILRSTSARACMGKFSKFRSNLFSLNQSETKIFHFWSFRNFVILLLFTLMTLAEMHVANFCQPITVLLCKWHHSLSNSIWYLSEKGEKLTSLHSDYSALLQ